jgi:predicted RNase H-like HicB family nuclease
MAWRVGDPLPRYHYRWHAPVRDQAGEPVYYVEFIELPGCGAQGPTRSAALGNLLELLPDYLAQLVRFGQPVPEANPDGEVTVGGLTMYTTEQVDAPLAARQVPDTPAEAWVAEEDRTATISGAELVGA